MSPAHQRFLDLPQADLQLIRQRNAEVARQHHVSLEREMIELLEIQSRGQNFALPLSALQGVAEFSSIAPIPRAPTILCGIVSFRGELLLGVELSALVGQASTGFGDLRRVIALLSKTMKMAILGEKILSVRSAPRDSFRAEPGGHPFVAGVDENFVSLLDPDLLVAHVRELLGHTHE